MPQASLRIIIPLLWLLWVAPIASAQQRYPANDSAGIAGTVPNSYLIAWTPVPGAIGYDYVVSDNPFCFTGCAGDTREAFVRDTIAVEYDLQINHRYYWITRTHFADGDTSGWSLIYSFTTGQTSFERQMVVPVPNPIQNQEMRLRFDWAQNPRASDIHLLLIGPQGQELRQETFRPRQQSIRYGYFTWSVPELATGRYLLRVDITERERQVTSTRWLSLLVP
jgi:hypothetical protein